MKRIIGIAQTAFMDFGADHAAVLAASLAFYGMLVIAPVLLLVVAVSAFLGIDAQQAFVTQLRQATGPEAAGAVEAIMRNAAAQQGTGIIATILAFGAMLFGASSIADQLRFSLNQIWDVEANPEGLWAVVRRRVVSLGLLLLIAVLLAASLSITTALLALVSDSLLVWQIASVILDVAIFTGLFALLYRTMPDVHLPWRELWVGALVTALLFVPGKYGISFYLSHTSVASAYGAAGSLVIILLWIYYSFLILFFGAEITQAYARAAGHEMRAEPGARDLPEGPAAEPV